MTDRQNKGTDMDELLRKAFADDLPPAVEGGMKERIERFRAGAIEDGQRAQERVWLLPRTVWAALAVLMLVAGILLQGSGSGNELAERISHLRAELSNDARLNF